MISRRTSVLAIPAFALLGCNTNPDVGSLVGIAQSSVTALALSDDQVRNYATQMVKDLDAKAKIAPHTSKYTLRLNALTARAKEDKGLPLNYKVYLSDEVNAFACADGSIRFNSALLDAMTDDEIRYVIGHEVGHVVSNHTKRRMQTALAATSVRQAVAASGSNSFAIIAQSEIGDLVSKVILAQHSQSNEREADDYAMEFMSIRKYNRKGAVSALEKFEKIAGGSQTNWLSTHPSPRERADRMRQQLA